MPNQRISLLKKGELSTPKLALPTVYLFIITMTIWFSAGYLGYSGILTPLITLPIQSICMFILFTPAHDSIHHSIGKNEFKVVNEIIGRCYGLILLGPLPAFRWAHLEHHKHTNTIKDPDMWASGWGCPKILLPLFWATQDYHYYIHYVLYAFVYRTRPIWEVIESVVTVIVMHSLAYYSYLANPYATIMYWMLPNRLAILILVYLFDYVPHYPQKVPGMMNPYKATNHIDGLLRTNDMKLDYLLLYQNYHNIHHLYPTLPFYMMGDVWKRYEIKLREMGSSISTVF